MPRKERRLRSGCPGRGILRFPNHSATNPKFVGKSSLGDADGTSFGEIEGSYGAVMALNAPSLGMCFDRSLPASAVIEFAEGLEAGVSNSCG
jgi:hypothetical protein